MNKERFNLTLKNFDAYNAQDPTQQNDGTISSPACLLYAQRMTDKLGTFWPEASETLQLAARSQHIGRWEIARNEFAMDRKGYLQWRSQLKMHHARVAGDIMQSAGYDLSSIKGVQGLLLKKQLRQNEEAQILEDVICLVFLEFYFDEFSAKHTDEKLIGILKKTIAKMSERGVKAALGLPLTDRAKQLISSALG